MTDDPRSLASLALDVPGLTPTQHLVLAYLAHHAQSTPHLHATINEDTIARDLGVSVRTVRRALARLLDLGYISE